MRQRHFAAGKDARAEWRPAGFIGGSRHASRSRTCNVSEALTNQENEGRRHCILRRDTGCMSKDHDAALTHRLVLPERGDIVACATLGPSAAIESDVGTLSG
jgi:hypothetical protein